MIIVDKYDSRRRAPCLEGSRETQIGNGSRTQDFASAPAKERPATKPRTMFHEPQSDKLQKELIEKKAFKA